MTGRRGFILGALAMAGCMPGTVGGQWVNLGTQQVSLFTENVRFTVLPTAGLFTALRVGVAGNAVTIREMQVRFTDGQTSRLRVGQTVRAGSSTAPVLLPGAVRTILHVDLILQRSTLGGTAQVTLQGMRV
ncbi:MAG: hypothetical protein N2422_08735 [Rhodobacteraceae bacterium]|nr:hypothetical protein [Paracoccaceae bacterium]